jgi:hypothetical protein
VTQNIFHSEETRVLDSLTGLDTLGCVRYVDHEVRPSDSAASPDKTILVEELGLCSVAEIIRYGAKHRSEAVTPPEAKKIVLSIMLALKQVMGLRLLSNWPCRKLSSTRSALARG